MSKNQSNENKSTSTDNFIFNQWTCKHELKQYRHEILHLTNKERAKDGLCALKMNSKLHIAAARQNYDIAFNQVENIKHIDTEGNSLSDRFRKAEYRFGFAAENIARGQLNSKHVMRSWMNSPGHKLNILDGGAKEIGIHVGRGPNGDLYWTQVFGQSREEFFKGVSRKGIKGYLSLSKAERREWREERARTEGKKSSS